MTKYLLCYDGSSHAQAALDFLKTLLNAEDSVVVFGATEVTKSALSDIGQTFGTAETHVLQRTLRKRLYELELDVAHQCKAAGAKQAKVVIVTTSDVRGSVLRIAREEKVSSVVLGTRGHSGIKRALVGSLADYLVTHADMPVIVVPKTAKSEVEAKKAKAAARKKVPSEKPAANAEAAADTGEEEEMHARVNTENFDLLFDPTEKVGIENKE